MSDKTVTDFFENSSPKIFEFGHRLTRLDRTEPNHQKYQNYLTE